MFWSKVEVHWHFFKFMRLYVIIDYRSQKQPGLSPGLCHSFINRFFVFLMWGCRLFCVFGLNTLKLFSPIYTLLGLITFKLKFWLQTGVSEVSSSKTFLKWNKDLNCWMFWKFVDMVAKMKTFWLGIKFTSKLRHAK